MSTVYLERHDPQKNMARFYRVTVVPTLFGPWALIWEWGRIGSPGTVREVWRDTEEQVLAELENLLKKKRKRGYAEPGTARVMA
jgi:predicted DNA-binding WGR domain protein